MAASVTVPNVTNVRLQMSHRFNTEDGYDGGQLLVAVDGGAFIQVTAFTAGGYTDGTHADPDTCAVSGTAKNKYPGWSGSHTEMESDANLSGAPFNVVAGDTISVAFRMSSDDSQNGNGWYINWVQLLGDP